MQTVLLQLFKQGFKLITCLTGPLQEALLSHLVTTMTLYTDVSSFAFVHLIT